VSNVPLSSQLPGVSPSSTGLPSTTDTIYDLSTPSLADLLSTRPSTDFLSSGPTAVGPGTENPEAFFTAALGSSEEKKRVKRVKLLVSVVRGFSKTEGLSNGLYKRLSGWPRIFRPKPEVGFEDGSVPETAFEAKVARRLHRLKQARQDIPKGGWEASRLWLVLLAHEVEYISQSEYIDLYTSRGVNPMSAAIKMAKKYLDTAGNDHRRGRNIVQVMKEGGPASLLLGEDTPSST
jgi:hypothetical protein